MNLTTNEKHRVKHLYDLLRAASRVADGLPYEPFTKYASSCWYLRDELQDEIENLLDKMQEYYGDILNV